MNLVVKEMIDVMKKRLTNLSKLDPTECTPDEAEEVLCSIEEAWKAIQKEYSDE